MGEIRAGWPSKATSGWTPETGPACMAEESSSCGSAWDHLSTRKVISYNRWRVLRLEKHSHDCHEWQRQRPEPPHATHAPRRGVQVISSRAGWSLTVNGLAVWFAHDSGPMPSVPALWSSVFTRLSNREKADTLKFPSVLTYAGTLVTRGLNHILKSQK